MSWIVNSTLTWLQSTVVKILKTGQIPKHVAIIMDGNRRYSDKMKVSKVEGHLKGFNKLAEVLQWCMSFGISEVTVYAFSVENFKRSQREVDALIDLIGRKLFGRLLDEKEKLKERGLRVRVIGNLSLVPEDVREIMYEAMRVTKDNDKLTLNVAFCYSSRDEITNAVKSVARGVKLGRITIDEIDVNLISEYLYTGRSRDPDLLVRTSGEVRFSDFLTWQTTRTCLYFTSVLWPEFSAWDLIAAIFYYQKCYNRLSILTQFFERKDLSPDDKLK